VSAVKALTWTALSLLLAFGMLVGLATAATTVPLGTADSFAILAGAGITNTGPTTVNGDIGTYPTPTITGAASLTITGTNHGGDAVAQGAKTDLVTAYNVAAGEGPTTPVAADLTGLTLKPGVYNSASSIGLTGALTLDAGGDPNAVFVFQAGSTLTTGSGSQINLINGAQSCNIFWQVGSSATLGTGSTFRGTVLALTSITVTTGVKIDGRVLARNGAVTLDTDTITKSTCATAPTQPTAEQIAAAKAAAAQAVTAKVAATQAKKAAQTAATAATAGNVKAARAAAARAKTEAKKAEVAATAAAKLAAVAKIESADVAAKQAAVSARAAKLAAKQAAASARVAAVTVRHIKPKVTG
jgi:type VI secretion system secreted protein VgrG